MKTVAALVAGLLLSMTTFVAGLVIALTFLNAGEPEHPLDGKDVTTLWSTAPVAVDKTAQAYERLPARPAPKVQEVAALPKAKTSAHAALDTTPAEALPDDQPMIDPEVTGSIDPQMQVDNEQQAWRNSAHADWCSRRYRSYDAETNSYRPYSGGRRSCESPYSDAAAADLATDTEADGANAQDAVWQDEPATSRETPEIRQVANRNGQDAMSESDHIDSCFARYRSYNPGDNTYQPYDGGPRRQCE